MSILFSGSEAFTLDLRVLSLVTLILERDICNRDALYAGWESITDGLWKEVLKTSTSFYATGLPRKGKDKGEWSGLFQINGVAHAMRTKISMKYPPINGLGKFVSISSAWPNV